MEGDVEGVQGEEVKEEVHEEEQEKRGGGASGTEKMEEREVEEEEKKETEEEQSSPGGQGLLTWVLSSPLSFSSSASRSPSLERLFSSSSQRAWESWAVWESRLCFWTWSRTSRRGTRRTQVS